MSPVAPSPASRGPFAPRLRRALALCAAVSAALSGLSPRAARADRDEEPIPPVLFFSEPDAEAKEDIERIIGTSFADLSKAVEARDVLVRRFGLVCVPLLVSRLEAGTNEPETWNAALTFATLRRVYGPSHLLWPAIRPLVKVLRSTSGDPWRRVFSALALGEFHGPDGARRSAVSREGTEEGAAQARKDLADAEAELAKALLDARFEVSTAAALALGKAGGTSAGVLLGEFMRTRWPTAPVETRQAALLATGLLPAPERDRFVGPAGALKDAERRLRAKGALGIACWAVAEVVAAGPASAGSPDATLAAAYEPLLVPTTNAQLRLNEEDGAEATFARGALALLDGRMATWEELYEIAMGAQIEKETEVAAAQDLLFAPVQSPVRALMAEFAGRKNVGMSLREPVLAAFLLVAGSDGSAAGVRACREFLRNKGKVPTGRLEYDVRYHAVVGLVRAYQRGAIALAARPDAADALEAAHDSLPAGPVGATGTFRSVLEGIVKPAKALLAGPDGMLPPNSSALLEQKFSDPDALLAHDAVDTVLNRLNAALSSLYNLEGLAKAAAGPPGARVPSKEEQPQRYLLGWIRKSAYFTRLDLRRDRGRVPAPPPAAGRDPSLELPRAR